jgi:peroxiredoxin
MKRLRRGDAAPHFDSVTLDGAPIHAPAAEWMLLSFLRYASCPMCNLRVRELSNTAAELESRGIRWVAVFHSPASRLERYFSGTKRQHIVADPHKEFYARYGCERSWFGLLLSVLVPSFWWRFVQATVLGYWGGAIDNSFHSMPADFLIAPDGRIRIAHYGKHIGDHVPVADVFAASVANRAEHS